MRFYQGLLPAVIWDPEKGRAKVEFKEGVFDTDDEELIEFLLSKDYMTGQDLNTLRDTGTSPHGGFRKVGENVDDELPSGRPPIEDDESIAATKGQRAKKIPSTEEQDLAASKRAAVKAAGVEKYAPDNTPKSKSGDKGVKRPRKKVETKTKKKTTSAKKKITRRRPKSASV